MFERRLKVFLVFLVAATVLLMMRAAQVQVVQHDDWKKKEVTLQKKVQLTETTRGRILDFTGLHELAVDVPCTDACVDYRAIIGSPDNDKWVAGVALQRLKSRLGSDYSHTPNAELKKLKRAEIDQVRADIESMWSTLAVMNKPTDEDDGAAISADGRSGIEEMRQQIIRNVEMRRRQVWYKNFQATQTKAADMPRWQRWLAGRTTDGPDISNSLPVAEETEAHVILRAIDAPTLNMLGKNLEKFPGLVLRASTHRSYPMKNVACHVLGRLSRVSAQDVEAAKEAQLSEDRMYRPNDVIGREGIESLCEPLLRGSRGKIESRVGDEKEINQKFVPGGDVRITIDADLQAEVQEMLKHVREKNMAGEYVKDAPILSMHGAAIVIDVRTSEVRALASNPDFDVNELDTRYAELVHDRLDNPLLDRATSDQFEPGSSVKPMVGLAGITQGVVGPLEGIECTGYLILDTNGRKERQRNGRCWVASEWETRLAQPDINLKPIHHVVPLPFPHRGHDGNADGWLTYSDALERSCNIFFEHVADRLGEQTLGEWYDKFGFGRPTGIGIAERRGLRPGQRPAGPAARMVNCFAGIGQGQVWATPLQIANEAATIARGGVWMRPRLLVADTQADLDAKRPRATDAPPDSVDLHLDPAGLHQARIGMTEVVNGDAGTGTAVRRKDMLVAGKTGTAQAARLWQVLHDQNGKESREMLVPVSEKDPVTSTAWYRSSDNEGKEVDHAWFMGFAPADRPEIAFCVFVEYGGHGGGGGVAGSVVSNLLDACKKHGYLHPNAPHLPMATAQ